MTTSGSWCHLLLTGRHSSGDERDEGVDRKESKMKEQQSNEQTGKKTKQQSGNESDNSLSKKTNLYRSKNAAQFLWTHPLHFASGS